MPTPTLRPLPGLVLALMLSNGVPGFGAGEATAASPTPSTPRLTLVWSEEFDGPAGSKPNPAVWNYDLGNAESKGWGNREFQYYTAEPRNAQLNGQGQLLITAFRTPQAGPCWNNKACEFTSARIHTSGKYSFRNGVVQARIRVPSGQGIWPAFWTLGEGPEWPQNGELDIMEHVGKEPDTIYGTAHGPGYSAMNSIGKPLKLDTPAAAQYRVYTMIKRPYEVIWQVDGVEYHRFTPASLPAGAPWVFERNFFLILNLAVGGDWPGPPDATTPLPAEMSVDWIRVYRED